MKNLNQKEAISIVVALLFVGLVFIGSSLNPFRLIGANAPEPVKLDDSANDPAAAAAALTGATNAEGELTELVYEDITVGTGEAVVDGDTVTVHYVGVLKDGTRFDDSTLRGEPFTFVVGAGEVIKGWDMGVVGMKKGGERVVVIPPLLGYGNRQLGPIPPNSTLLFSIRLLEVK